MSSLDDYPNLIDNTDQPQCPRCGRFCSIAFVGEHITRINCSNHGTGTEKISLTGDERIKV